MTYLFIIFCTTISLSFRRIALNVDVTDSSVVQHSPGWFYSRMGGWRGESASSTPPPRASSAAAPYEPPSRRASFGSSQRLQAWHSALQPLRDAHNQRRSHTRDAYRGACCPRYPAVCLHLLRKLAPDSFVHVDLTRLCARAVSTPLFLVAQLQRLFVTQSLPRSARSARQPAGQQEETCQQLQSPRTCVFCVPPLSRQQTRQQEHMHLVERRHHVNLRTS